MASTWTDHSVGTHESATVSEKTVTSGAVRSPRDLLAVTRLYSRMSLAAAFRRFMAASTATIAEGLR